jgi:hypothetical protein
MSAESGDVSSGSRGEETESEALAAEFGAEETGQSESASAAPRKSVMAPARAPRWDLHPLQHLRYDLPSGLVVFLVALPLCLGVALVSGAPPLAGLIAGCVGGIVVPLVSRAPLSVSGPAAGLAAIVLAAVEHHGFPVVCAATVLAGGLQIGLGLLRAGFVVSFVQSSVIRGMLAAIGILLILKQVPHAIGYDHENFAGESFEVAGEGNTFALFFHALSSLEWGAVLISVASLGVLWGWEAAGLKKKLPIVPAALVVVVLGAGLAFAYPSVLAGAALDRRHFVDVPEEGFGALVASLGTVAWQALLQPDTWILGAVLGIVASLESLLSLDAVDRLDPYKRRSDTNRELIAQGLGNTISGALGGLPITSVIVRSGANVDAGGRTQAATFTHGVLLLGAILALATVLSACGARHDPRVDRQQARAPEHLQDHVEARLRSADSVRGHDRRHRAHRPPQGRRARHRDGSGVQRALGDAQRVQRRRRGRGPDDPLREGHLLLPQGRDPRGARSPSRGNEEGDRGCGHL